MSASQARPLSADRMEAAAQWFVHLREARDDGELIVDWLKWCQAHPDNQRAFAEVERTWRLAGDAGAPAAEAARAPRPRPRFRWAYAAGLAAMLVLAAAVWRSEVFEGRSQPTEYATAQGVEREVRLADGSVLELGGASAVRVSYSTMRRDLELLRGEAYFTVQHAQAPFVVRTRAASVRAVGTAFNVRADGARTVVTVTEGTVDVVPNAQPDAGPASMHASAGQQVSLESTGGMLAVQLRDVPDTRDWQEGMLSFFDEPLSSVVARVNRYSSRSIALGDDALGDLRFTGTVMRAGIEDWAKGLERVFPITVEHGTGGEVRLMHRDGESR